MKSSKYLTIIFLFIIIVLSAVLAINIIIDPLWYFGGNKLNAKNLLFNERLSKINDFFSSQKNYDCLIFGNSRSTFLKPSLLDGYSCYNFSFSGGMVEELVEYANYLKKYVEPKLIIVSVDYANTFLSKKLDGVPDFVLKDEAPDNFLFNYLSLSTLRFSYRTLLDNSPLPRLYDDKLEVYIIDSPPKYKVPKCIDLSEEQESFFDETIALYTELVSIFPNAMTIGYIPPISAWTFAKYFLRDEETYKNFIFAVYPLFDEFYDYSAPNFITTDPSKTYDGSHFDVATNEAILKEIMSKDLVFGEKINDNSVIDYVNSIKYKVQSFMSTKEILLCGDKID